MPLNPFCKKENRTKHKSSSTSSCKSSSKSSSKHSSERDECKILCCKKKFAKIATGILATGLVASQCEINRINNNVLIVEPKFEAILTTVMQNNNSVIVDCSGASGSGEIQSVAFFAMQNAVWPDLSVWECSDPCLNNFIFAFEYNITDQRKQAWGSFNVLNHDLLELKYSVDINQGETETTLTELAGLTSADSSNYAKIVAISKNLQCMLAQINKQIAWPYSDDSYNFKPLISNASYIDKLDNNKVKNARIATWKETCESDGIAEDHYYLIGFSSKACRKTCSPCK